jgi:cystathionine beta-lyase
VSSPFDGITLAGLRTRASTKWTAYPPDVLPAWIAEMDVALDPAIRATLLATIENDDTGYATRRRIAAPFAAYLERTFGWAVEPAFVTTATDVLAALAEVLRALTEPGAPVVINSPVYPPFYRVIGHIGRTVCDVPLLHDERGWALDFAGLERAFAAGAHAYVLCSPHNPLGRVWSEHELTRIAELAQRYRVVVIADEIHAPLTLSGATFVPFLAVSEPHGFVDGVALWSASKAWNLAGLKCATIVAGSEPMQQRLRGIESEPSQLGVLAGIAAYEHGATWLRELNAQLDHNRTLLGDLLAAALPGVRYRPPEAGYLAWLDCAGLGLAGEPVDVFLARGRVALSRGRDFGPTGAACVRLNFGTTPEILTEVVERMRRSLS